MEIKGTVKTIGVTTMLSNGTTKRTLLLTQEGNYPKDVAIDFFGDKCAILDGYNQGESVTVGINIESKEHNGKYYTNIVGWKINKN